MPEGRHMRGRPADTRLGCDLAVIHLLSREGSVAAPSDVARLLGIGQDEVEEILRLLAAGLATGDDQAEAAGPALPLYGIGPAGSSSLVASAGDSPLPALRLTEPQAEAVDRALAQIGVNPDDPFHSRLEAAFYPRGWQPPASSDAEGASSRPGLPQGLLVCARSMVGARMDPADPSRVIQGIVTFGYQGENDVMVRQRHVVPRSVRLRDDTWLVDAHDVEARATRTFLAARMVDAHADDSRDVMPVPRRTAECPDNGFVCLLCSDATASRVRSWEGAHEDGVDECGRHVFMVPYYRGDWLPRHILALGPDVTCQDEAVRREMADIARDDLERARALRERTNPGRLKPTL